MVHRVPGPAVGACGMGSRIRGPWGEARRARETRRAREARRARQARRARIWDYLSSLITWTFGTSCRVTMPSDWIRHHSGQGLCCLHSAFMCFHFVSVVPSISLTCIIRIVGSMLTTPLLLVLLTAPGLNRKTRTRVLPAGPGSQASGWDKMPQWMWENTVATYVRKNSKRDAR